MLVRMFGIAWYDTIKAGHRSEPNGLARRLEAVRTETQAGSPRALTIAYRDPLERQSPRISFDVDRCVPILHRGCRGISVDLSRIRPRPGNPGNSSRSPVDWLRRGRKVEYNRVLLGFRANASANEVPQQGARDLLVVQGILATAAVFQDDYRPPIVSFFFVLKGLRVPRGELRHDL